MQVKKDTETQQNENIHEQQIVTQSSNYEIEHSESHFITKFIANIAWVGIVASCILPWVHIYVIFWPWYFKLIIMFLGIAVFSHLAGIDYEKKRLIKKNRDKNKGQKNNITLSNKHYEKLSPEEYLTLENELTKARKHIAQKQKELQNLSGFGGTIANIALTVGEQTIQAAQKNMKQNETRTETPISLKNDVYKPLSLGQKLEKVGLVSMADDLTTILAALELADSDEFHIASIVREGVTDYSKKIEFILEKLPNDIHVDNWHKKYDILKNTLAKIAEELSWLREESTEMLVKTLRTSLDERSQNIRLRLALEKRVVEELTTI